MKINFKENVNMESFIFKKRVEENTISLIESSNKYLKNDIKFYTMISFLNSMVEDDAILIGLETEGAALEKIENEIEPLFKQKVLDNDKNLKVYEEIVEDLINYYNEDVLNKRYMGGLLNSLLESLNNLKLSDIEEIINMILTSIKKTNINKTVDKEKAQDKNTEKVLTKEIVENDIEDLKMKALIEKYSKVDNKENATE